MMDKIIAGDTPIEITLVDYVTGELMKIELRFQYGAMFCYKNGESTPSVIVEYAGGVMGVGTYTSSLSMPKIHTIPPLP